MTTDNIEVTPELMEEDSLVVFNEDYLDTESGEALVEDCRNIITETEFASKDDLIQGRHQLGERIINDTGFQEYAKGNTTSLQRLAQLCKRSKRTVYYSIKFYQKYPDLSLLPSTKNESWHHIINKYLTEGEPKVKPKSPKIIIQEIKQLLEKEWQKNKQEAIEAIGDSTKDMVYLEQKDEFIRYLQDQIEKICQRY